MWFLSAVKGEIPLIALKVKTLIVSISGYTKIDIDKIGLEILLMM